MGEIIQINFMLFIIVIAIFSLMIGSFLNVIIYRLPKMLEADLRSECAFLLDLPSNEKPLNLFIPRSFCTGCHKTISALCNIPIISYIVQRGRCTNCNSSISYQYPLVEFLCCALSVYAACINGGSPLLIFQLIFIWILIPLFFIDINHQLLPDSLTLSLLWLGLIANSYTLFTPLSNAVYSTIGAYLFLWLLIKLFYLITGKIGMGNGDFKLFAAFGAWFGWVALPFILLVSSLLGGIVGIIYLFISKKSRDTPLPFGPFLSIAGLIYLFKGNDILIWYLQ